MEGAVSQYTGCTEEGKRANNRPGRTLRFWGVGLQVLWYGLTVLWFGNTLTVNHESSGGCCLSINAWATGQLRVVRWV